MFKKLILGGNIIDETLKGPIIADFSARKNSLLEKISKLVTSQLTIIPLTPPAHVKTESYVIRNGDFNMSLWYNPETGGHRAVLKIWIDGDKEADIYTNIKEIFPEYS